MTRTHANQPVWVWQCDTCGLEQHHASTQQGLPSPDQMRAAGWFIAPLFGDLCPTCNHKPNPS